MRSGFLHMLSGMVLASVAVMAPGCSQDTLNSGSLNLDMAYTPSPSGTGRFDNARFTFVSIEALPADPAEAALYGTERLLFSFSPFIADLTRVTPVTYSNISLSEGTYNVTKLVVTPLDLVDTQLAPPPYASCIDGIAVIDSNSGNGAPASFTFNNPPTLTFTVYPGQTTLALTVNVPGLIAGYEAAFAPGCQLVPCPGCPVDPRPTLTTFNSATFRAALLANITIR